LLQILAFWSAGSRTRSIFNPLAGAERSSALQRAILVLVMPTSKHHVALGQLFERDRFRWSFVEVLGPRRTEMGFLLIGWVLRPDHFRLLIKPEPTASTSRFMQELKKRTAQGILSALSENQRVPRCGKMRARLRLPPTVHSSPSTANPPARGTASRQHR